MIAPLQTGTPLAERAHRVKLVLAFASIYLLWGSTYVAIRYAVATIPPLTTAGVRDAIAGLILLAVAAARGFRPKREHWLAGLVAGALFFLLGHSALNWAEQYVPSGTAALLITTEPMFILVLGWLFGQQRFTWVSAFSWAAGVVVSPRLRLPSDALARTAIPLVCGGGMLLMSAGIAGEFQKVPWSAISLGSLLGLAYLIVLGSVVAFTAYTWLLQLCPPTLVATHTYANPLVAVLLGWLLASEPLTVRVVFALIAVLGAIVLIRRGEHAVVLTNSRMMGIRGELSIGTQAGASTTA